MVFLGVDPGSSRTGIGLVAIQAGRLIHVAHGVISAGNGPSLPHRLQQIYEGMEAVIQSHRPAAVAVESIFHAKNPRSSLVMGQARGVILLAAVQGGVEIYEYTPLQVKIAVTGYGHAGKEQIRAMVRRLLGVRAIPPVDASDALAVAICHAHSQGLVSKLGVGS